MEIIHLILGKANPERMNGVNKVVNSLAIHQKEIGLDVKVWGISPNNEKNYPERNYKTELFISKRNKLTINKELKERICALSTDAVVHMHGGFIPEFYHVANILYKQGIKYVLTPHGAYNKVAMQRSKARKWVYFNLFEKTIIRRAHALHCIGQSELDEIQRLLGTKNNVLIPNGQKMPEWSNNDRNMKDHNRPVFGFCGRLDIHTKGLDLLLTGFSDFIHKQNGEGELWIIGDSKEMERLQQMARQLNVFDRIKFHGKVFGEKKDKLLMQMDAFFHPSRNEGLPGAVLEAAALKVPCVVSKESNMAGYIDAFSAGIGLESNDSTHISRAMGQLEKKFSAGTLSPMGENAVQMITQEFSWINIARQFKNVYFN